MKKSTLLPLFIFVLLAGALYYVLSSFDIRAFSGSYVKYDELYQKDTMMFKNNISLMDVQAGKANLDLTSWGKVLAAVIGFPLVVALLVRFRIKRKQKKRLAAIHASQAEPQNMNQPVA